MAIAIPTGIAPVVSERGAVVWSGVTSEFPVPVVKCRWQKRTPAQPVVAPADQMVPVAGRCGYRSLNSSETTLATCDRSTLCKLMWAKISCPINRSITAITPSALPTLALSR